MIDLLLTGGTVISMDKQRRVIGQGAVAVDKGKILFVGTALEAAHQFPDVKTTVDCQDKAIMPGLINSHSHGGHALIRGAIFDTSHWMAAVTHLYNHYTTDDYWYYEGKVSALDHLKAGVTTTVSITSAENRCDDPIFSLNHARAYAETGLREVICNGPSNQPRPHQFSRIVDGKRVMQSVSYEQMLQSLETIIETLNHSHNDRIRAFVSCYGLLQSTHPIMPTQADQLAKSLTEEDVRQLKDLWRIADKYDTRIHAEAYGGGIHQMHKAGKYALLGPRVHLQHTSGCSFDELQILADTGTHVGVTFQSTTMLIPMLWMGVKIAIGTDGPKLLGNADMFQSLRMVQARHKDSEMFSTNGMFNLPPHKLLEMITVDAAEVIGWDDDIGSLEVGKKADIITVNLLNPRMTPRFNIIDTIVMLGNGNDVDNVFVDGVHLLRDGKATLPPHKLLEMTTIDAAEIIGWGDDIGSLEAGKKADIITVNILNPRMMPRFNLIDTLVMLGNGNDIDNVFVDGVQLLADGKTTLVDERKVLYEGHEMARRSLERIGFQNFMEQEPAWGQIRKYETREKFDLQWQREDGGYY